MWLCVSLIIWLCALLDEKKALLSDAKDIGNFLRRGKGFLGFILKHWFSVLNVLIEAFVLGFLLQRKLLPGEHVL